LLYLLGLIPEVAFWMVVVEVLKDFMIEVAFLMALFPRAYFAGCCLNGHHSSTQMPHIPSCFLCFFLNECHESVQTLYSPGCFSGCFLDGHHSRAQTPDISGCFLGCFMRNGF
jgi:hypothetical protein